MGRGCKKCIFSHRACGLLRFGKGINKRTKHKNIRSLRMCEGVLRHLQANYMINIMKTNGRVHSY